MCRIFGPWVLFGLKQKSDKIEGKPLNPLSFVKNTFMSVSVCVFVCVCVCVCVERSQEEGEQDIEEIS